MSSQLDASASPVRKIVWGASRSGFVKPGLGASSLKSPSSEKSYSSSSR
ncbi:MAG: hypothetical protein ACUVQ0_01705 [Thermoproteota archaeon]